MGPLRRSATTSVLLVAALLLGDGASAGAVLADAAGGHGLDRGIHGKGAWLPSRASAVRGPSRRDCIHGAPR